MGIQPSVIVCPNCGTENDEDAKNCVECRINLEWALDNYDEHQKQMALEMGESKRQSDSASIKMTSQEKQSVFLISSLSGVISLLVIGLVVFHEAYFVTVPICMAIIIGPIGGFIAARVLHISRTSTIIRKVLVSIVGGIFISLVISIILGPPLFYVIYYMCCLN